jgi:site-specific recombinase XerD
MKEKKEHMSTFQTPPSPTTGVNGKPTINEAIRCFLSYQRGNLRPSTLRNYRSACRRLQEYLDGSDLDDAPAPRLPPDSTPLSALTADHLIGMAQWLHQRGLSANSKATYLSALQNLVSYLFREGLLLLDARQYERLRSAFKDARKGARRKLPYIPGQQAIDQLLAYIRQQPLPGGGAPSERRRHELRKLRDVAMFELLRDLALRPQELVALRRGNLDGERQELVIEETKSKEGRRLAAGDRAWDDVGAYLEARQDGANGRALRALPVFANHSRRAGPQPAPISTRMVRWLAQKYARLAEIEVRLTPYGLRHQAATDFWEATGDLVLVRDYLGHQDVATTQIYVKVSNSAVNDALREMRENARRS